MKMVGSMQGSLVHEGGVVQSMVVPQVVVADLSIMQPGMVVGSVVQGVVAGFVEGVGRSTGVAMQVVQVRGMGVVVVGVLAHVRDGQLRVVQLVGVLLLGVVVVGVRVVLLRLVRVRAHVQHAWVRGQAAIHGVTVNGAVRLQNLPTSTEPHQGESTCVA